MSNLSVLTHMCGLVISANLCDFIYSRRSDYRFTFRCPLALVSQAVHLIDNHVETMLLTIKHLPLVALSHGDEGFQVNQSGFIAGYTFSNLLIDDTSRRKSSIISARVMQRVKTHLHYAYYRRKTSQHQ